jgi:hypothetical protein
MQSGFLQLESTLEIHKGTIFDRLKINDTFFNVKNEFVCVLLIRINIRQILTYKSGFLILINMI